MTAYWELLRDPRWQRKRLEIMERDNFACVECQATEKTLNVHHAYYAKGRKPWEYENESLRTLCEVCHGRVTSLAGEIHQAVGRLGEFDQSVILGFARALLWLAGESDWEAIAARSPAEVHGVLRAFGVLDNTFFAQAEQSAVEGNGALSMAFLDETIRAARADYRIVNGGGAA